MLLREGLDCQVYDEDEPVGWVEFKDRELLGFVLIPVLEGTNGRHHLDEEAGGALLVG